jgi:hypothetical protein
VFARSRVRLTRVRLSSFSPVLVLACPRVRPVCGRPILCSPGTVQTNYCCHDCPFKALQKTGEHEVRPYVWCRFRLGRAPTLCIGRLRLNGDKMGLCSPRLRSSDLMFNRNGTDKLFLP